MSVVSQSLGLFERGSCDPGRCLAGLPHSKSPPRLITISGLGLGVHLYSLYDSLRDIEIQLMNNLVAWPH